MAREAKELWRAWPTPVDQPEEVDFVAIGTATVAANVFACALAASGQAYCWGHGGNGTLGHGSIDSSLTPVAVDQGDVLFNSLVVANGHTCGLTDDGQAYCWGIGNNGRLGEGSVGNRNTPSAVDQIVDGNISFVAIVPGGNHTCAVTNTGRAYCWGQGEFGRLGAGTTTDRLTPHRGRGDEVAVGEPKRSLLVIRTAPLFRDCASRERSPTPGSSCG